MAKKHLNEGQENYNESKVFIPNGFVGMGNSTKGFNYNSSWGGRWENGGIIPYTPRTKNIPSNGKYAKKTKASARDGKMLYFQQGLDFNPKTISANGSELEKLDQLVNWTNYNIAEDGLTMLKPLPTPQLQGGYMNTQQQLQPMSIPSSSNSFMESIGGVGGIANTAGKLVQGIQQLGAENRKFKQVKQDRDLVNLQARVAELPAEQVERKYAWNPNDPRNIIDANALYPTTGVGTNVLKDGGEIQNTYAPNTLYKDLEYLPIAENGIGIDPYSAVSDVASNIITSKRGKNAGGTIGGTVGGVAGTLLGGPLGGAIGNFVGTAAGQLLDGKARKTEQMEDDIERTISRIGMGNQIQQQYTSYMEDGGELKYISHDWLPKTYASLDEFRSGGNLKADYIPPTERGLQTYALGGDIQTHWGGGAEPISYNPYLPDEGETVMFKGQTHDESDGKGRTGIGVTYGNNPVEVENNEPAVKLGDGGNNENLVVFGNLQIPKGMLNDKNADGRKFKSYIADLSKKENKQNKVIETSIASIDDMDIKTPFDKLKFSALKANILGGNMKLKEIADKKTNAANLQSAINDTAEEHGLIADDLAKGKITKAKNGIGVPYRNINSPLINNDFELRQNVLNPYIQSQETIQPIEEQKVTPSIYKKQSTSQKGNFKTEQDISNYYYNKGYSGSANQIGELQRWIVDEANKNPQVMSELTDYLRTVPTTNKGKKLYGNTPSKDLTNEQLLTQFQDDLWGYRFPKLSSLDPQKKTFTPIDIPEQESMLNQTPIVKDEIIPLSKGKERKGSKSNFNLLDVASGLIPYLRPSDAQSLDPRQLAGEMYALSHNQVEPVYAQTIQPDLSTPMDISFQDQLNAVQGDFRSAQRSVQNNPAALAQLTAQKYDVNQKILGEQFRQNQQEKVRTYDQNRNLVNQAKLQNMNILAQQQDKQSLAESNTKAVAKAAISSIADKYLQNQLENRTLGVYENLYNYRFDDRGRAINMNAPVQFNIPTVTSTEPTAYLPSDYEKAKAVVKAHDEQQAKNVKAMSKSILPKKTRNGDIIKAFKGY